MTVEPQPATAANRAASAPSPGIVREVLFSERLKREQLIAALVGAVLLYILVTVHAHFSSDDATQSFDQRMYIRSSRAFAAGDLDPQLHWYPLLYSLAGAAFAPLLPQALFFFVNLLCSVIGAVLFVRLCAVFKLSRGVSIAFGDQPDHAGGTVLPIRGAVEHDPRRGLDDRLPDHRGRAAAAGEAGGAVPCRVRVAGAADPAGRCATAGRSPSR